MVKTKNFSQTHHCGSRAHYSSGPKNPDFSPKMQIVSQGPILSPRPQILGPGTLPGWVLLITEPLGYWTKKVGSLVSGFLASSTLKRIKQFLNLFACIHPLENTIFV